MAMGSDEGATSGRQEEGLDVGRHVPAMATAEIERLEAERVELAALVEVAADAMWSWAPDGTIRQWNAAAQHLFGYSPQDIMGRSWLELVPPEHRARALDVARRVRDEGWFGQYHTIHVCRDGSAAKVELTVSPIRDRQGMVVGGCTTCRERNGVEASVAKHVAELTALYELTERLQRAEAPSDIYDAALNAIEKALACDRASILIFDAGGVMRFVAWRGLSERYRTAVDGHSPWTTGIVDPKPIFMPDILASDESAALKATVTGEGIRGLAFIPLVTNGRLIGKFMTYYRDPHVFTPNEMNLASTIARQLALSVARQIAEEDLRQSEARFRLMSEQAPVMIWISDPQGECLHLNQMLRNFWGIDESALGDFSWVATMHPDDAPEMGRKVMEGLAKRSPVSVKGRYLNAEKQYRVLETNARPRFSSTGEFLGMIGVNVDVTERDEAEKARELLVAELNHRVKNTLSIVQGIAHQTFRHLPDAAEARRAFEGRLVALAQAHNLLTQANWENASLAKLAELALDARGTNAKRVLLAGPPILLQPKEAVAIAMALHELCTNAMKYGALSNETGRITLNWGRTDGASPQLELHWRESGGPPVRPPSRRGFGSLLLERTLAQDLDGNVTMSFDPAGLSCRIGAPLRAGAPLQ